MFLYVSIVHFVLLRSHVPQCGYFLFTVEGHLGCVWLFDITNKAAMRICVQIFIRT